MNEKLKLLTFDTHSATTLSLIRNLGEEGIEILLVKDKKSNIEGLNEKSKYIKNIKNITWYDENEKQFINDLINIGKKDSYIIIATDDNINSIICENFNIISKYFKLPYKNADIIKSNIDKKIFYNLMKEKGVSIPKTIFINQENDLLNVKNNFKFPIILKPNKMYNEIFRNIFGDKYYKIYSYEQLLTFKTDIFKLYGDLIIQECINYKKSFCIYGFFDTEFKKVNVLKKDLLGEGGTTVLGHLISNKNLISLSNDILRSINYNGFAELEFLYDEENNEYKLLEINTRPVQWCRITKYANNSCEIYLFNKDNKLNIKNKDIYIYYESGLIELYKQKKISFNKFLKIVFGYKFKSMFSDYKDLMPTIRYKMRCLKQMLK